LIEWAAALAGVVSVWLSARQNIWSWPTGIVNVGLYTFVFYSTGLYAETGLQVVYLVLSVYGWYQWLHGGADHGMLAVSRATPRIWLISGAIAVVFWFALASYTSRLPGVSLPYLDSALTTLSLVAQWMMTRKYLENWILWIIADIVYIPMFIYKDLYPTAGQYAVFLVLATMGFIQWRRSLTAGQAASPAPAAA
jgi:nicotinamide mononucleotide transporter